MRRGPRSTRAVGATRRTWRRTPLTLAAAAVCAIALAACGGEGASEPTPAATDAAPAEDVSLTVFAAASLQQTFTELGESFEAAHDDVTVTFSFAGSSDLAAQIIEGAPADVFAAANEATMATVVDSELTAVEPIAFATNVLTIVTPPGNPAEVASFADLATPGLALVVCADQVPCGAATARIEEATGITLSPVSEESAVTDVLGKVTSGEADAGLVYVTDAAGAGDAVTEIPFPESSGAVTTYPIAPLAEASDAAVAQAFVDFVLSDAAQSVLREAGFAPAGTS